MVSAHVVEKRDGMLLWSCLLSTNIEGKHWSVIWEWLGDAVCEELVEKKEDCLNTDLTGMEQSLREGNWYGERHFVGLSLYLHVE